MLDIAHQHLQLSSGPAPNIDDKSASGSSNLYLCQPYAVIELVEVSPPPPRRLSSVIDTASYASSSSASSSGSADDEEMIEGESDYDDEDEIEEDVDEEDDEDEDAESYCSSDFPMVEETPLATPTKKSPTTSTPPTPVPRTSMAMAFPQPPPITHTDSFKGRMKRILLWRERALTGDSNILKRKLSQFDSSIPTVPESYTSKRSRSSSSSSASSTSLSSGASSHLYFPSHSHNRDGAEDFTEALAHRRYSTTSSISSAELEMHPCPACDAFFPTLASLRAHGKATGNEACVVAVEYAFE